MGLSLLLFPWAGFRSAIAGVPLAAVRREIKSGPHADLSRDTTRSSWQPARQLLRDRRRVRNYVILK